LEPVDIILATHNNLHLTAPCIHALYQWTPVPFNLTIIDDSTDLTEEYIKWLQGEKGNINYIRPDVKIKDCPHIINIGLENTTSDPVIFMGNSTFVEPDWIQSPLQLLERVEDCGIVGGKVIDAETRVIEQAGMYFMEPMMNHMNHGMGEPSHRLTYIRDVQAVGWSCAFFRRAAVPPEGIEEGYYVGFQGMPDFDYCVDLRNRGWRVLYCGYSTTYHQAFATRARPNEWDEEQWAEYSEARLRFLARHCTWGEFTREDDD